MALRPGLLFSRKYSFPRNPHRWRRLCLASTAVAIASTVPFVYADEQTKSTKSIAELVRSYFVYSMCSVPTMVDASPKALSVLSSIPIVRQLTEAFVRVTFFDQFVGADTAVGAIPLVGQLRSANKGTLFAYSVEVDEAEARASYSSKASSPPYKRIVNEMIHSIDVAADFEDGIVGSNASTGRRTWVAVKMTALLPDAQALVNLSSHIVSTRPQDNNIPFPGCPRGRDLEVIYSSEPSPYVSADDKAALRELDADLSRICSRASERGVRVIIDAEYSWYQPAIDALQLSLMQRFNQLSTRNQVQPLVYGTFQAYLRRTPAHLKQSLQDSKTDNFALGVKLVRGAYHPHELAAFYDAQRGNPSLSISTDSHPPVWEHKDETDRVYNECAKLLVDTIQRDVQDNSSSTWQNWIQPRKTKQTIGVLFGTHNWHSCDLILEQLVRHGLATESGEGDKKVYTVDDTVTERLTMGQLYGMSDALTDYLVQRTRSRSPLIMKYVPYGALSEVMPYLSRRAIENKSILGNGAAAEERRHAGSEIRRRLLGGTSSST